MLGRTISHYLITPDFIELNKRQSDPEKKRNYQFLLGGVLLSSFLFIVVGLIVMFFV